MMVNTGYPYDGFEEQYPETATTPEWYGFGHKHQVLHQTPVKHIVLVDGQQKSEISVTDPDEPLDFAVADILRGQPAERGEFPVSRALTLYRTERPGARPGLESSQFAQPDTRPAVIKHALGRSR